MDHEGRGLTPSNKPQKRLIMTAKETNKLTMLKLLKSRKKKENSKKRILNDYIRFTIMSVDVKSDNSFYE